VTTTTKSIITAFITIQNTTTTTTTTTNIINNLIYSYTQTSINIFTNTKVDAVQLNRAMIVIRESHPAEIGLYRAARRDSAAAAVGALQVSLETTA
jgi:hypothetical protein